MWGREADLAVDGGLVGVVWAGVNRNTEDPERTDQIAWELISRLAVCSQRMGPRDLDSWIPL